MLAREVQLAVLPREGMMVTRDFSPGHPWMRTYAMRRRVPEKGWEILGHMGYSQQNSQQKNNWSEIRAIYAGLVMAEKKCIEMGKQ